MCSKQKEKKDILKLQIKFRRIVLNQIHPNKEVFQFSYNRKQYSVSQLKNNLFLLIGVNEEESVCLDTSFSLPDAVQNPQLLI